MGISSLFPVQVAVWQETIGPGFFERDLCINSPTGSGKTLAYALPIVQKLSTRSIKCLQALVVLPTRDLALQVVDETDRLLREAYQSWLPNVLQLAYSQSQSPFPCTDGIVPTFGVLKTIRSFGRGKPHPRLAKMVLSATLTQDPSKLAQLDLHYPLYLTTGHRRYQLPEQLKSFKVLCKSKLKPLYLLALLETLQGKSALFSHHLKTLKAFRAGEIQVLISSDAMTRGMDVEGVKNVINYDMPPFIKTYIHRAGRTARAGQSGRCFTLLHKDEVKRFKRLLQKADNDSCPVYSVPSESMESFRSVYSRALERLKESVESDKRSKGKVKVNIKHPAVTRKKETAFEGRGVVYNGMIYPANSIQFDQDRRPIGCATITGEE
ncbi:DEAD-box ATP-dependent RNA helicase 1 [Sesamum angolense]|uniref:ATP-dependent RNA helicase n=1 Tax=Sesamum angolense TaxID=2727404 RepID=A0AAE2BVX0_9LAMI|nr:DEAD-box ATP-dependent RNA helicase 1 [Sesamum angolense]